MDILGDSDSENEQNSERLTINKKYAKSYDEWRKKEERQKLIDKYGEDADSESSSSSEEEIRSTPQLDKEWLRAYAVVRFNQPRLHSGEQLFHGKVEGIKKKNEQGETLKDYERRFILEKGGVESEEDSDSEQQKNFGKTYHEEQQEIKDSFKAALQDSDSDGSDVAGNKEDSLLVKKIKTQEQQRQEENDYLEWLKGERENLEDEQAAEELAPLREYWNNPDLPEKERVLRDYILNNGYMDREDSADESSESYEGPAFGEEEEFLDQADDYERKYNFRHEEPGGSEIKSYPRVIETSVRVKDNRRAGQRQRRMDKKKEDQRQRQEEVRLLQKLQREAKEEKLSKLRDISENPDLHYDLDADFDPEEHSKIMEKYFNENYYDDGTEGKKPVFQYDEAVDDNADDWWHKRNQAQLEEEANDADGEEYYEEKFNMDADFDENVDFKSTKKRDKKEKKKKGKSAKQKKPAFDPSSKTFDEFVNEYLKDKISTLPFPYRQVVPNDFGLSTEEILKAPDRELNSWVSVKKMSVYRSNYEERMDIEKFDAKARNLSSKYKKMPSLLDKNPNEVSVKKKKKRKKKKKEIDDDCENEEAMTADDKPSSSSLNNHTESSADRSPGAKTKEAALEGLNPKKKKEIDERDGAANTPDHKKKKKRKIDEGEVNGTSETPKKKKTKVNSHTNVLSQTVDSTPPSFDTQSLGKKDGKKKVANKDEKVKTSQNANSDKVVKKKKKKLKKADSISKKSCDEGVIKDRSKDDSAQSELPMSKSAGKKKKLKKSKLHLDTSSALSRPKDKKAHKEDLKKVMSSYRLSKYGIGPAVVLDANASPVKRKKKKKKKIVNS